MLNVQMKFIIFLALVGCNIIPSFSQASDCLKDLFAKRNDKVIDMNVTDIWFNITMECILEQRNSSDYDTPTTCDEVMCASICTAEKMGIVNYKYLI